ncbi:NAD-dependent isocitrate dehydrogenase [Brettanomyces nanus]|uniref:Isocitrate dehydrogenase [NAD] subunit 2, mitochondrial n=1 Tax=Eeniella nana TaxID=13502 RepID=A0A875S0M7_EENNA|nr:NAD-dependent isocitrate dehydrogenase [Brettanomyces nanus]QPG74956.1 NAD-dependent isocitrate dehydrogenase [Brettanomyces nanus]
MLYLISLVLPAKLATASRSFATAGSSSNHIVGKYLGRPKANGKYSVTLVPGDGIGPEISKAVEEIYGAADVPVDFESVDVTPSLINGITTIPKPAVDSIYKNTVALKGPLATPIGKGHQSLNLTLRRTFGLFANVRPCRSVEGYETPYKDVDTVLIRENTEGEYSGIEHIIVPGVVQSIKLITKKASTRVIQYAFEFAKTSGRPKVLVVHKASIMKMSDGLFVQTAKEVGQQYPEIELGFELLDNTSLKLASNPGLFKDVVMVMPNLYGDILSDLSSGLIGGLGLTPSGNMGEKVAIFEAVHGSAPDIAGKGLANPTALLLSSCMMLQHMKLNKYGDKIQNAVLKTIASGPENRTRDLKGTASTEHFTRAVIDNL